VAAAVALATAAALIFFVFRSVTGRPLQLPRNGRPRPVRLGLVDAFRVDRQRQLVIVRRDSVEHLLMIGGPNDLLIESQIVRSENRDSRNYREAKFRDKELREWEPREPALSHTGHPSALPAEDDLPGFSHRNMSSPAAAGDELAELPNEAEDRLRGNDYEPYEDAGNFGPREPLPARQPAFDLTAVKSKLSPTPARRSPPEVSSGPRPPAKDGSPGRPNGPPGKREWATRLARAVRPPAAAPISRPLTERQARDEAPRALLSDAPEPPPDGTNGFVLAETKEGFAAPPGIARMEQEPAGTRRAPAAIQASLSPSPEAYPELQLGGGPQEPESLGREIARILGRERR
jgi:flagellar protein FliO/FliZ